MMISMPLLNGRAQATQEIRKMIFDMEWDHLRHRRTTILMCHIKYVDLATFRINTRNQMAQRDLGIEFSCFNFFLLEAARNDFFFKVEKTN